MEADFCELLGSVVLVIRVFGNKQAFDSKKQDKWRQ